MPKATQTPVIRYAPLTGKWYCITKYKDNGRVLEAQAKFDVTDEVDRIVSEAVQRERKRARAARKKVKK